LAVSEPELNATAPANTPLQHALAVAIVVLSLVTPFLTAYVGATISDRAAQRETSAGLIELASSILREPPKPNAVDIRDWAMDVLEEHSGVVLSEVARNALKDSVSLPAGALSLGAGVLSPNGVFTAPSVPGLYPIIACAGGGAICDTVIVQVGRTARESLPK
jgi:hypothetical protein